MKKGCTHIQNCRIQTFHKTVCVINLIGFFSCLVTHSKEGPHTESHTRQETVLSDLSEELLF